MKLGEGRSVAVFWICNNFGSDRCDKDLKRDLEERQPIVMDFFHEQKSTSLLEDSVCKNRILGFFPHLYLFILDVYIFWSGIVYWFHMFREWFWILEL